jgi:hypothetical protein
MVAFMRGKQQLLKKRAGAGKEPISIGFKRLAKP